MGLVNVTVAERLLARTRAMPADIYERVQNILIDNYATRESLMVGNEVRKLFGASANRAAERMMAEVGDDQPDVTLWYEDEEDRWIVDISNAEGQEISVTVNGEVVAQ